MPFLLNGQPLAVDQPFTDTNGTQYPANWLRLASDEEKTAVGITWQADPLPYDGDFYVGRDSEGDLVAKPLEDWSETDEFGVETTYEGLKTFHKRQQKEIAASLLAPSDWYVVRKAEDSAAAIPAAVGTYRAAVRTTCGTREGEINACTTVAELEALLRNPDKIYDEATDSYVPNTEPFITPWPEEI